VSPSLPQRAATSLRLRALDARDRVTGAADPLVPPRRRQFIGAGDYVTVGDEFLALFVERAGLRPTERVLDVGSGIGRIARPLVGYLTPPGRYAGFDPDPDGVAWCREAYADHANFAFDHVDAFNTTYNPTGTVDPATLRFPHEDDAFDLVVMTSVLTHLLPDTVDNYLRETRRVLAPGGRLFGTWLLLDDDSRAAIAAGRPTLEFLPERDGYAVVDEDEPEAAVAYDRDDVLARLRAAGFAATPEIAPGSWPGTRPDAVSYQDIVVVG
jgi:SAM-dependent methyltransferase